MINETTTIDMREPTPQLSTLPCKILAFSIRSVLQFGVFVVGFLGWYFFNYYIALASAAVTFIMIGVLRSGLSRAAIAPTQLEYHYTDQEVAQWYVAKEVCFTDLKEEQDENKLY